MGDVRRPRLLASDSADEKHSALKTRVWELFGFGTQYAWLLCVVFGSNLYAYGADGDWACKARLGIIVGMSATYLGFYLLRRAVPLVKINKLLVLSAGVVGVLGSALLVVPSVGPQSYVILTVSSLLSGYCCAVMMLEGNVLWANYRPERAMMHIAPSVLLSVVFYYLLAIAPVFIAVPIICALPLAGGLILASSHHSRARAGSYRKSEEAKPLDRRLLLFIACFAFVTGCVFGIMAKSDYLAFQTMTDLAFVGIAVASSVAFILAMRRTPSGFLESLDAMAVPLMSIGLILLLLLGDDYLWLGLACVLFGYICEDLCLWILNAELVFRMHKTTSEILARSASVQWGAMAIGFLVGCGTGANRMVPVLMDQRIIVGFCAIVLIIARGFVFTKQDSVRVIKARNARSGEDILQESYAIIAERHALSVRETDVFELIARGRSGSYIQTELSLSESTIKTHTRNIYRKVGVNNKQDLIDLVMREC